MVVGIYCRVSSKKQEDNQSLGAQRKGGIRFCKGNDYQYKVYEEVVSGTIIGSKRDAFSELESDLYNKKIDAIWIYDWDRMMREEMVGLVFRDLIIETKCKLFVGGIEKDLLSDSGALEFGIGNVFSSYWRRKIVRVMDIGKKEKWRKGEGYSGRLGIGYKKNKDGKVIINEKTAKVVRDVFKMFLYKNVRSYEDLWRRINKKYGTAEGIGRNGRVKGLGSSTRIREMLCDDKYLGVYTIKSDDGNEYAFDFGRIIDDEVFDMVRDKMKTIVRNRRGSMKLNYLLKGKVFCGDCNDSMWVKGGGDVKGRGKGDLYRYYYCKKRLMKKRGEEHLSDKEYDLCISANKKDNAINTDRLSDIVWIGLFEVLKNSDRIKKEYKLRWNKELGLKSDNVGKLKYYERKLVEWNVKKDKQFDTVMSGKMDIEDFNSWKNNLFSIEVQKIKDRIYQLKKDISKTHNNEKIDGYLDLMNKDLNRKFNSSRFEEKRRIIEQYVDKVFVRKNDYDDKLYDVGIKLVLDDDGDEREVSLDYKDIKFYKLKYDKMQIEFLVYKKIEVFVVLKIELFNRVGFTINNIEFEYQNFDFKDVLDKSSVIV